MLRADSSSPQPSVLLLVAGTLSLVVGCLALVYPHLFAGPPVPVALRQLHLELSRLTVLFLVSGTCGLLAFAVKARRDRRPALGLAALATLPFVATLVHAAHMRVWMGVALAGAFALGLLLDTARPWHGVGRAPRCSALAGVGLATALAFAGLGLIAPGAFGWPAGAWLADALPYLIGGMGAAAALLAAGAVLPRARALAHAGAALPFLALAVGAGTIGRWVGVVTYGMLGAGLALEPWLLGLLQHRIQHRQAQSQSVAVFEFATEAVAWGFTLLVALVALLTDDPGRRVWLGAVTVASSLFTTAWYHLVPATGGICRTVFAATVYSALTTAFVWLTGGVHSPYFFLVFLPTLTLAWTHAPRTIIVPAVLPVAGMLAEAVLAVRSGVPAPGTVVAVGVPRLVGLLLVSGLAYVLAMRNLQGRRKVEESHRQLQTVLTHMAEGLVCTDSAGRIQLCNPVAAALVGRTPEDVHGAPMTVAMPFRQLDGAPLAPAAHPLRRALGGQPVPWLRVQLAATPALPVAVTATPLRDDGHLRGAVVLLRDARAEVEMERVREDFFFIASHELRTPLTVMKGNLEMALEADPPEAVRAALEDALASTTRLIRMVNDFLDAARLEHGALTVRVEDGDLCLLVQQAIDTLRPDAERKGLMLTYVAPAALPPVRMDAERTLQILVNLIGNGIRHTTRGGVEITHAVEDHVVETCVRDTGAGIAPEQHERLFTRFGQLERGLTRTTGGSGLGLYISRKLAEQMGGTVVLKASTVGRGSTFALRLPAAAVPAASR
ncbi:MAG: PAS domain-containing sensor histidine kinase [Armatimonadota bacterium]|nr:PAS domain-containing sensor histidine kinase [Armatimonadota bacterium]MDR7535699.1 PAS domain-containing sensor histidine kinase [Armatimonadota bacterium]